MNKIFIFIPAYKRIITITTFETTHKLMPVLMQNGIQCSIGSFSWPDIAESRGGVLSWWYDCLDYSHLFMLDDDIGFEPQLVLDMLRFNQPLVGALYPKRTYPLQWAGSGLEAPEILSGFMEVEGVGAGALLIRRDAITAMIEKFPDLICDYITIGELAAMGAKRTLDFFRPMQTEKGKVSEDISFCRRYREAGGRVWGAIGHNMIHEGPHPYEGCFYEVRHKLAEEKAAKEAAE